MSKNGSLRRTLLLAFILVIILLSAINLYTLQFLYRYHKDTEKLLDTLFQTTTLSTMLGENHQRITNAINYRDTGLIDEFIKEIELTTAYVANVDKAMLMYAYESGDMNSYYKFLDIQKSVLAYRDKGLVLTRQYLSEQVARAQLYDALYELKNLKDFVADLQNELLFRQSLFIQTFYEKSRGLIVQGVFALIIVTITVLALCFYFSLVISRRISLPIHELGQAAIAIGRGEHESVRIPHGTNNEIALLAKSFNAMSQQLKTRQDIERKLQENEMRNLQMENMLRSSEMKLLQSRIHPHFLFNTLHMVATLTQIEEAPQAEQIIVSLSNLLRYILKNVDQKTLLNEELSVITDYMNIQIARFGNKITYKLKVEPGIEHTPLPALSIQPFVENSIIHGLEPKKGKGTLSISCSRIQSDSNEMLKITISDNGIGMSPTMLQEIQDVNRSLQEGTHLGIANTVRRLELVSKESRVFIESTLGEGTTVQIVVPIEDTVESETRSLYC